MVVGMDWNGWMDGWMDGKEGGTGGGGGLIKGY
jgi:hypothetical protein